MANKNTPNTSSILQTPISVEMKRSYLNYAMSVIVARALPDIRDGLKPVHRRILYAMHRLGLHHTARFSKSAKVVGEVLGKYHPHGDIPVYDALVRMAQTFSTRYPLVHGQGNFGSMDGDPPAAMRYTEAKLTRIAREMLTDIDKDTIGWRDNFDGSLQEPAFLPAKLPNLLLMGAEGIAVGMATRIPPHNVSEVIDAIIHIIDHAQKIEGDNKVSSPSAAITYVPPTQKQLDPFLDTKKDDKKIPVPQSIAFNVALDDLMKHIKGPDFPTAATIYGIEEIRQAYATGRGKILVRGKIAREEKSRGREAIIIKELPYQVNKAKLVAKVADLVKNKKIEGIADLRDESDKDGVRVVIELKRDAAYNKILNNLYKHTDLQTTYPVNMVALIDEQPQTVSLRVILESYLKHRVDVIKKRSLFELLRSRHRAHILQGLLKALDHIDEIVDLIKKSKTEAQAKAKLVKKFKFSDIQAQAILDMQLKRLTGLERGRLESEMSELEKLIESLEALLTNAINILRESKKELLELKKNYGDKRLTKVVKYRPGQLTDEELIENKKVIITLTSEGYIKRVPRETFKVQKRGGKGVAGFITKEEDKVSHITSAMTHDSILFFTTLGKVYQVRGWEIPKGSRVSKGKAIVNILSLSKEEIITAMLPYNAAQKKLERQYIFMCTRGGVVKKTQLSLFKNIRSNGIIAIRLDQGDNLQWVRMTNGISKTVLATTKGQSIVFSESDVRPTGRASRGVVGIKLAKGDTISSMDIFSKTGKKLELLVLTVNGIGKKTRIALFPTQKRGGKGVKIANLDERTGNIAFSSIIEPDKKTLVITSRKGQVVKIPIKTIPSLSRTAKGVILMRFSKKGDSVVSSTFL